MSSAKEKKVADLKGKFIHPVIRGNNRNKDASWTPGRLILTNKNVWLIDNEGKSKIPLDALSSIGGKFNVNQAIVRTGDYISLVYHVDGEKRVSLISSQNEDNVANFRDALFNVLLNRKIVYIKHPVSKGGVMQSVEWNKAQMVLGDESVRFGTKEGGLITVNLDEVQEIDQKEAQFQEEEKQILSIKHQDDEGVAVTSYIYATGLQMNALSNYVGEDFSQEVQSNIELGEAEKQVLMALYSGVSPFDIPSFIGEDIDKVEEIYEDLIDKDVLSEVRKRREVTLTTRGRNLASKSMGEE